MLCHLGPEQTDHSINISHGLLKNDAEFEYPVPPSVTGSRPLPRRSPTALLPAPEPSGSSRTVVGLILEEEVGEGVAQDAVEVEPRNFAGVRRPRHAVGRPDRRAAEQLRLRRPGRLQHRRPADRRRHRPRRQRPLRLAALAGGPDPEEHRRSGLRAVRRPRRLVRDGELRSGEHRRGGGGAGQQGFEETGDGAFFPGTTHTLQSVNPGFERDPIDPQMPEYMAPWIHSLPAGELHPQIDEMAGMVPNTITAPNGGPGIEFPEIMFGADFHCAALRSGHRSDSDRPTSDGGLPTSDRQSVSTDPVRGGGQLRVPVPGHVAGPQPRDAGRRVQGAPAAQRGADRSLLPHGQLPDPAPGGRLLFRGRRLPGHQRGTAATRTSSNLEMQAFAFGPTQGDSSAGSTS